MRIIKWLGIICFCFLISMMEMNISDANVSLDMEELVDEKHEYDQISGLEKEIMQALKEFYKQKTGKSLSNSFKLDFKKAKKIYVDSQIFSLEDTEASKIKKRLKKSKYMWLLPVSIGKDTYQIHIAKELPLNESVKDMLSTDEIQQIKENEGKWCLSGIELLENEKIDYEKKTSEILDNISYDMKNVDIMICGGLEHVNQPVVLVLNEDEAEFLIPLYELEVEGTEKQIKEIKPKRAKKDDEIYTYEGIMNAANHMDTMNKDFSGVDAYIILSEPNNSRYHIGMAVIFMIVLSVGIVLVKNRRRGNQVQ
ncbi:MAG: hypothetical protein HFH62_13795 [Lachnospiraceae bacterium]|nr:hypothetical protein [Lachnospiraceae bacterium]